MSDMTIEELQATVEEQAAEIEKLRTKNAEILAENAPTPMARVGIGDTYGESAPNEELLEKYGLTPAHVAASARRLLQSGPGVAHI